MSYVDTNVILSYAIGDETHEDARRLLEMAKDKGQLYVSTWTITELCRVIAAKKDKLSRMMRLNPEAEAYFKGLSPETEVQRKAKYLVSLMFHGFQIRAFNDEPLLKEMSFGALALNSFWVFSELCGMADGLVLPMGDFMHVVYARWYAKKVPLKYFLTMDEDIIGKKDEIKRETGIDVISPKDL
ncbi:PIN domain-containing protein [Tardisphaera miroshnichenkoae]